MPLSGVWCLGWLRRMYVYPLKRHGVLKSVRLPHKSRGSRRSCMKLECIEHAIIPDDAARYRGLLQGALKAGQPLLVSTHLGTSICDL